ncbi:hypothetical protein BLNAU_5234 [Blattamonas nauphoetae]|uniref:Uncharacterized protein n=1 Tax=Blattamonas nauphoetae TaxID=2049346 RepID=A0ABQ9Y7M9_9EUKA|nr:hypothetical protein BLNAU_5834 [Blattamonas nauphoetae]KAK2959745.1 hypothetical protein BLNAU_5234 [Blattamonas nauphoetae]
MVHHDQIVMLQALVSLYPSAELAQAGFPADYNALRQPKRLAKEGVYKKQYKPVSPNSRKLSTPDFVELYQWIELNTTVSCETQVVNGCPSFEDCLGMPIQSVLGQEMDLGKKNDTKYESKPFPWFYQGLSNFSNKDWHVQKSHEKHKKSQTTHRSTKITFIFDTGTHFRNGVVLCRLLSTTSLDLSNKSIHVRFFNECHGKSYVDASFGELTNLVRNNLGEQVITTIPQFIQFLKQQQAMEHLRANHTFIHFQPETPGPLNSLVFHGISFYLNYTRDAIPIKATGLPTDDPDKWDTIIESFRLKTRNHPEKEFPEAVPHFRSGTSEQTLNQIKNREEGISPLKRISQNRSKSSKRRRSPSSDDEVTQEEESHLSETADSTAVRRKEAWIDGLYSRHPTVERRCRPRRRYD